MVTRIPTVPVKSPTKGKLLVVDDEQVIRDTIEAILRHEKYECVTLPSPERAMDVVRDENIDLVLTDMHFEGSRSSGLDLINRIIQLDETIPVILVTGFPSINTAVEAMKRGAVDYLTKPFERERLLYLVAKALQERRLRQENQRLQAEVNKAAVIEKLNRELNSRIDELTRINKISEGLNDFLDTNALFEKIVQLSAEVTGGQRISVMLLDRSRHFLKIRASMGLPTDIVQNTVSSVHEGIAGLVIKRSRPVRANEATIGSIIGKQRFGQGQYRSNSWLSLPLRVGEDIFGVINLTDKLDGSEFTHADEQIMSVLAEKAGIKLENQALYEGIYSNLIDTLNSLVTTLEAKDPYTRDHSQRVTDYSVELGRYVGLEGDQLEMLGFAGILHDIGKIGVRDEILTKNGRLTDDEYRQIKHHPAIGVKIVEPLGLVEEERSIIRHHHERYDGRGYPDGLAGEDIPLLSRIVCITDAFDAMTTTRSYRNALSVESAVAEIKRCAGSQFDPNLAQAMLDGLRDGAIPMPTPQSEQLQSPAV